MGLISHSITLIVVAVLVLVGAMVSAMTFAPASVAAAGAVGAGVLFFVAVIVGMLGKFYCTKSPVATGAIQASLALDVVGLILGFSQSTKSGGGLLNLVSLGCFMYFLYALGGHLRSTRLIDEVMVTVKRYFGGLGLLFLGAISTAIMPPVGLLLAAVALFMVLSSFFKYLSCLTTAQSDLQMAASGDGKAEFGSTAQF